MDPRNPTIPLGPSPLPELHGSQIHNLLPEADLKYQHKGSRASSAGIMVSFLSDIAAKVSAKWSGSVYHVYEIERTLTSELRPSDKFVNETLRQPAVTNYLAKHMLRKSLYMVVAIKIAQGAKVMHFDDKDCNFDAEVGASGAPAGVPVNAAVKGSSKSQGSTSGSCTVLGDFVFAIRLRKCRYYKSENRGEIALGYHTSGANLHDLDSSNVDRPDEEPVVEDRSVGVIPLLDGEISKVDLDDYALDIEDAAVLNTVDEGEKCRCIMLGRL